jgi:hypothetical protein
VSSIGEDEELWVENEPIKVHVWHLDKQVFELHSA